MLGIYQGGAINLFLKMKSKTHKICGHKPDAKMLLFIKFHEGFT